MLENVEVRVREVELPTLVVFIVSQFHLFYNGIRGEGNFFLLRNLIKVVHRNFESDLPSFLWLKLSSQPVDVAPVFTVV